MKTWDHVKENIQIAYIGGGSRGWAWGLMSDLAVEPSLSGHVKLYDIDFEAAAQNAVIGNRLTERSDTVGKWTYEAVPVLKDALRGADVIIISILPGTFQDMKSDVHLPEEYGIYQSVGDTIGPGGLVRALRTVPIYVEFAEAIRQYAPGAWVINYTNPMTLCTRTLYEIFPGIKAVGCCHEVFGTQKLLAKMLETKGYGKVDRRDIKVNVLGINHFTWLDQASYKDIDLMPMYREFVDEHYEEGFEGHEKGHWMNDHFASANRVKFDLFKRYGVIAAAGDRHLAEFMPGDMYLKDPETVRSWKFSLTSVDWRIGNRKMLDAKGKRLASGEEAFELKPTGEEGVDMIKAFLGLTRDFVTNVNLPNRGQMQDIPLGAVVETNAVFGYDEARPVVAGRLPDPVHEMVLRHVNNQEMTLKAALNKDKQLAFQAFVNDPLVRIPKDKAEELFERMLQNTKHMLPGWDL